MASIPRKPVPVPSDLGVGFTGRQGLQEEVSSSGDRSQSSEDLKDPALVQELLLRDIANKLGMIAETSKHELRLMHSVVERISLLEDSKVEFIWTAILQTIGLIFVIIFGVFAVLAYNASEISNKRSAEANQLSLLAYCDQAPYAVEDVCFAIQQQAVVPLTSLATAVMGPSINLTPTTSPTTPSPSSSTELPTQTITTPGIISSSSSPASSSESGSSISTAAPTNPASTSDSSPTTSSSESPTSATAPTPTIPSGSTPETSQHLSSPAIAGIVVGVFSVIMSIAFSWFGFRARFQKRRNGAGLSARYGDYLSVSRREV
ncbi:hypothetical protein D0Z07_5688 [Hyphodiscus hymeniophilus]|uniref:Uncharacterized protein n=1 Tax=Hyphodiscus hymeniophilus TaxID=353542 RepID=A0A9P6VHP6_9HELO|nr:hypothetical protein D0Z07_5688 [Hyphodiscus hymeniophilus]